MVNSILVRYQVWGMERIEKTIFLSYRRTNIPWALAIFHNLTQHGFDVFFDYDGIASGDFERVILGNITARAHFLILLTPSALERCDDPADWVRREIETALANQRNIVPLMVEGFDFGTPKIANQLTGTLAALKHYNGLSIPPEYFLEAMERLRGRYLNVSLTAVLHPASLFAQRAATEQKAAADAAPVVQEEELTAQQWFERGFAAADLDEKLRFYTEAIRLKPDYAAAFNNRGIARRAKGDVDGALQDFTEAIRLQAGPCHRLLQPGPCAQRQRRRGRRAAGLHRGHPAQAGLCHGLLQPGHCAPRQRRRGRRAAGLHQGHPAQAGLCRRLQQPGECAQRPR